MPLITYTEKWLSPVTGDNVDDDAVVCQINSYYFVMVEYEFESIINSLLHLISKNECCQLTIVSDWIGCEGLNDISDGVTEELDMEGLINCLRVLLNDFELNVKSKNAIDNFLPTEKSFGEFINWLELHKSKSCKFYKSYRSPEGIVLRT